MSDSHCSLLMCDLNQQASDERASQRRSQWILSLIDGSSLKRGPDEVAHKIAASIYYHCFDRANLRSSCGDSGQIALVADIDGYCDDIKIILFFDPANGNGGIQATRIS